MLLPIITYPDKKLKLRSSDVTCFDETLHCFLDNMFDTMMHSNGIGLAAIQVANPIRALILCIPDEEGNQTKENLFEIINPRIENPKGSTLYQEGCLSVPGFYEEVERSRIPDPLVSKPLR
jgi:peptide deformylase